MLAILALYLQTLRQADLLALTTRGGAWQGIRFTVETATSCRATPPQY